MVQRNIPVVALPFTSSMQRSRCSGLWWPAAQGCRWAASSAYSVCAASKTAARSSSWRPVLEGAPLWAVRHSAGGLHCVRAAAQGGQITLGIPLLLPPMSQLSPAPAAAPKKREIVGFLGDQLMLLCVLSRESLVLCFSCSLRLPLWRGVAVAYANALLELLHAYREHATTHLRALAACRHIH